MALHFPQNVFVFSLWQIVTYECKSYDQQLSFERVCHSERISMPLMVQQGGEPLLYSVASPLNYLLFAVRHRVWSVFFFFLPSKSKPPHLSVLHIPTVYHLILQHKTIFTFLGFIILKAQVIVMVYPPLCFFIPPLYICYFLHPAIGILLTLVCLIRVRQRERKTKASPFLPPSTCPLPPSSACSFSHLPLTPQSAGSCGDSANSFVEKATRFLMVF